MDEPSDHPAKPGALEAPARPGCGSTVLFALTSLWVLLVTYLVQGAGWFAGQYLIILEEPFPPFVWVLISWLNIFLVLLPVAPLALLSHAPRFRGAYRTWAVSSLLAAVLALSRFLPEMRKDAAALAQIVLALACAWVLARVMRQNRGKSRTGGAHIATSLTIAAVAITPWVAFGALGSPLDSALNLVAGLAFGLLGGILLDEVLLRPLAAHSSGPGWDILFGGFVAGAALALLSGGFGFGGNQLLLMAALPPLGFALVAVGRRGAVPPEAPGPAWRPMAALAGLAAAAPLMFFDPNEISLLLDMEDVPGWALRAAERTALIAVAVGLLLWAFRGRAGKTQTLGRAFRPPLLFWTALLALYFAAGRPGFHGDQLFVILRDQADLSAASTIADRAARGQYVYDTLVRKADSTQGNLRSTLDQFRVGYRPYYLVNGLEVNGGPLVRWYLSSLPEVDRILDSPHLRPLPSPLPLNTGDEGPPAAPQWNITSLGADRVWRELGVTGAGIVVGQSDSGVEGSHPALQAGYRGSGGGDDYNWLDPWYSTASPTDRDGHGTHTLGSVLGRTGVGVAPGAEWFACVILPRNLGNPAVYMNCMQFMLAPYPQAGDAFRDGDPSRAAHITNNSWGCPPEEGCDAGALAPATAALRAAGIFVSTSAGNSGPRCSSVSDPIAIYPTAFAAGALNQAGAIADFSSRGPVTVDGSGRAKPDILAPGVDVLSSFPGNSYKKESGTSMAGPHVAGVVALMWSAQPKLIGDIERTEQILEQTARPYNGPPDGCAVGATGNSYGYSVVDAYAAVQAAKALGK